MDWLRVRAAAPDAMTLRREQHTLEKPCTRRHVQDRVQLVLTPLMLALVSLWDLQPVDDAESATHCKTRSDVVLLPPLPIQEWKCHCRPVGFRLIFASRP